MNRITIGLSIMAGSCAAMLVLVITGSSDLWTALFALLALLAGALVMSDGWIPVRSRRHPQRPQPRNLASTAVSLRGPGTASQIRDRSLQRRWMNQPEESSWPMISSAWSARTRGRVSRR